MNEATTDDYPPASGGPDFECAKDTVPKGHCWHHAGAPGAVTKVERCCWCNASRYSTVEKKHGAFKP